MKTTEIALPLEDCLAKTYDEKPKNDEKPKKNKGRQVLNHCQIVGEVAKELMERMPEWLRNDLFPVGSELIAACHDIGKVSPTFQKKIHNAVGESFAELKNADPEKEKLWGGHAGVSQAAANAFLRRHKYPKDNIQNIPKILGQHHGSSPKLSQSAEHYDFGGETWQQRREELIAQLKAILECDFPGIKSPEHARVLAGLTSVADWIGSSSPLFDDPAITDWKPRLIEQALDKAGFIRPTFKPDLTFSSIFDFEPHDSQTKLFAHATQAGVYILEAPMGLGKTEAALYAAYKAMSDGQATGLYFALPTQLTSDKIHDRVNRFLTKILADDSSHKKALLAHGSAWLQDIEFGVEGNPNASWFDDRKRKILAPFAVGTIDQALMAVMNVKHGFVRAFGLAGKVVILDEVHSYDSYTGTILDNLVKTLQELHCTVIILSATLTQERRAKLLAQPVQAQTYPLISAQRNKSELQELTVTPLDNHKVTIHCCQTDSEAIEEALIRAEQGQQVLWIENTVAEAQERFRELNSRASGMKIKCGLLHSRFLKTDRARKENYWVKLYGKDNASARKWKGRILVGTQVLEQSLDIDADFLITRFAPTDMLLQRIGRLWRHKNPDRNKSAQCEAWLLVPELNTAIDNAVQAFGNSAYVYAPYVLCRSLDVWHELHSVSLPADIRTLIEATYIGRIETGKMSGYFSALEKKRTELRQLALGAVSSANPAASDDNTNTRYSEIDSVQVLLLKNFQPLADKTGVEITLLTGEKRILPRGMKQQDKAQWREIARILLKNTLQVSIHVAPQAVAIKELMALKEYIYLGRYASIADKSLLRVAKVDESGEIKSLVGGQASEKYQLNYDNRLGYFVEND
jgi:CRISPR-associated endonuclease/helicase Cas3